MDLMLSGLLTHFMKGRRTYLRRHRNMSSTWPGDEAKAAPVSCSIGGEVFLFTL